MSVAFRIEHSMAPAAVACHAGFLLDRSKAVLNHAAMASDGVRQSRQRRSEQRANRRRNVPVRCWVADGEVDRYASLADISLDGARLFTAAPPVVGRRVSLRFSLRSRGAEVRAEARVVWRSEGFRGRGGVMGVQFVSISGADEIAAYVGEG